METLKDRPKPHLAVQAFWLIIARSVGFVFTLAMPIVLVRLFSTPEYGLYKQAFVIVNTAMMVLSFGFAMSAYYYLPRFPEKRNAVALNIAGYYFGIGLVAFVVLTLFPGIIGLMLGEMTLSPQAPLIGCVIWLWLLGFVLENIATADGDVRWSTLFIICAQISRAGFLIAGGLITGTVEGVLWAAVLQGVLQMAALAYYLHIRFPGYLKEFDKTLAVAQFKYSVPFAAYGFLASVQTDMNSYIGANRFNPTEYAIYAVGTAQLPFLGILRDSVNGVIMPRISKLQLDGQKEETIRVLLKAWRWLAAALFPAFALLMAVAYDFVTVLYTTRYAESVSIFRVNLLLLVFGVFVADAVMRTHAERSGYFVGVRVAAIAIQFAASLAALRWFGLAGPVIGMLVSLLFEYALNLTMVLRLVGFRRAHLPMLAGVGGFAVASLFAGVIAMALSTFLTGIGLAPLLRLVVSGICFAVVYAGTVVFSGMLAEDERQFVNRLSMRMAGVPVLR